MTKIHSFRDDINGLRAWAVVAVILFHFGIPGFDGGFVGVDIFFVISGFLMTGIIIRALEKKQPNGQHSLSLINFYISRGRRIIPALLVLCLVLVIAGYFFLPASEYRAFGAHSASALAFLSNFKFWSEAGYFDVASHEKWLLHTWSLSVEWQFYMILPISLLLIWKIAPKRQVVTVVMTLMLLVSFGASVISSYTRPSAAFFLLHSRAWEMLAGGLVFLIGARISLSERASNSLYVIGFIFIIISIVIFDSNSVWPGANALLPVMGTVLVLLAEKRNAFLTGHPAMQRLGDWSYSLYLWHWPFAVMLTYLSLQDESWAIITALALTLVLGWASYKLIETPARIYTSGLSQPKAMMLITGSVIMVAIPSIGVYHKNGVPGRLPPEIEAVYAEADNKNSRMKECHISLGMDVPECTYGGEEPGIIVIGDSHAASFVRTIEKILPSSNQHVLDWTLGSCPTILGLKRVNDSQYQCGGFLKKALSQQENIDPQVPLVVINRLSSILYGANEKDSHLSLAPSRYINRPSELRDDRFRQEISEGFIATICAFSQYRPVYIVKPVPELIKNVPKTMGRALQKGSPTRVSISLEDYELRHRYALDTIEQAVNHCGAVALDPVPYLCNDGRCWGDLKGLPIYYDDDHLNERGAEVLISMFKPVVDSFSQSTPIMVGTK